MDPLVTIAIPTYNRGDHRLHRVISAALLQSWKNIEVLISDNASTDNTEEIALSFTDPRVRYIRQPSNIGANANFNFLLKEAKGKWFLLFHDDDMVDPDFIECCLAEGGRRDDVGFIISGVRSINADGEIIKEVPNRLSELNRDQFYLGWFKSRFALYLCNTLYNSSNLRSVGGFHSLHNLLEDNYALVKLLDHWTFCICPDVKASFRYSYDQRTFNVPVAEWCQDFDQLLSMIVAQSADVSKVSLRNFGRRFFGELCVKRANANTIFIRKLWSRLVVARYFGARTLGQPWGHPKTARRLPAKTQQRSED